MSRNMGQKVWTRTFESYCPQTNTGLWWGFTRKPMYTEKRMRDELLKYDTYSIKGFVKGDIITSFFKHFLYVVLSKDYMREVVEVLCDIDRHLLEETVYSVMIKKEKRPQNCVINCIHYIQLGLVKYFEELETVLEIKKENNNE